MVHLSRGLQSVCHMERVSSSDIHKPALPLYGPEFKSIERSWRPVVPFAVTLLLARSWRGQQSFSTPSIMDPDQDSVRGLRHAGRHDGVRCALFRENHSHSRTVDTPDTLRCLDLCSSVHPVKKMRRRHL